MANGGVTGQVANELKSLGQEAGKQLGQAGEEIVKGTVSELLGSSQRGQVEQGVANGTDQQVPVRNETEELQQRKEAEKKRGLERVRNQMKSYVEFQERLKEELSVKENREVQIQTAKKEEKKMVKRGNKESFWSGFLGKIRSQHGGAGEMVKTKH